MLTSHALHRLRLRILEGRLVRRAQHHATRDGEQPAGAQLDAQGLDGAFLFPTLGVGMESSLAGDRPALLCYDTLAALRVHTARLGRQEGSPEQWVAQLADRGIDGLALAHTAWHGGLVALAHRFGRYALARGPEHERELATVFDLGIDGVSCRHVDRLMAVAALYYPEG